MIVTLTSKITYVPCHASREELVNAVKSATLNHAFARGHKAQRAAWEKLRTAQIALHEYERSMR